MPQTIEVKGVKYEVSFQGSTITVNKKVWKLQGKGKASLATFTINSAILQPDGSLKITVFVDKPFLAPDITKQETLPANKVAEMLEHFAKQKNPQTMTVQDSGETHQLEFTLSA